MIDVNIEKCFSLKKLSILLPFYFCLFTFTFAFADECLQYKINPVIKIETQEWKTEVIQPLQPMDLFHGNVVATLDENYEITAVPTEMEDGTCVALKSVSAVIGYTDFSVAIDSRHTPDSCTYNVVLAHENEHIKTYLSVIDDYKTQIFDAVKTASDSITPIFVPIGGDTSLVLDTLHNQLQSHPALVLLRQKIHAEQELRNKQIDDKNNNDILSVCE